MADVMAHIMRTQRLGEDSMPREEVVAEGLTMREARRVLRQVRKVQGSVLKKFHRSGTWDRQFVGDFRVGIYDQYYIRVGWVDD